MCRWCDLWISFLYYGFEPRGFNIINLILLFISLLYITCIVSMGNKTVYLSRCSPTFHMNDAHTVHKFKNCICMVSFLILKTLISKQLCTNLQIHIWFFINIAWLILLLSLCTYLQVLYEWSFLLLPPDWQNIGESIEYKITDKRLITYKWT